MTSVASFGRMYLVNVHIGSLELFSAPPCCLMIAHTPLYAGWRAKANQGGFLAFCGKEGRGFRHQLSCGLDGQSFSGSR